MTPIRATWSFFSDVENDVLARITEQSNDDYDNDVSDNCDHNFGTFDDFGVKNEQKVSHNMILMSKYKGQHGGKRGRKIRARPSPLPFRTMPERKRFCYKRCSLTNICAGIPFLPLSLTNISPGTPWQGLGFSLSQSTFSSLSRLRRRARGSWCGFGTASGQSSSPSASKLNPDDN